MKEIKLENDPKKDPVVQMFTKEMKARIPNYLKNVALYGSRNKRFNNND